MQIAAGEKKIDQRGTCRTTEDIIIITLMSYNTCAVHDIVLTPTISFQLLRKILPTPDTLRKTHIYYATNDVAFTLFFIILSENFNYNMKKKTFTCSRI